MLNRSSGGSKANVRAIGQASGDREQYHDEFTAIGEIRIFTKSTKFNITIKHVEKSFRTSCEPNDSSLALPSSVIKRKTKSGSATVSYEAVALRKISDVCTRPSTTASQALPSKKVHIISLNNNLVGEHSSNRRHPEECRHSLELLRDCACSCLSTIFTVQGRNHAFRQRLQNKNSYPKKKTLKEA